MPKKRNRGSRRFKGKDGIEEEINRMSWNADVKASFLAARKLLKQGDYRALRTMLDEVGYVDYDEDNMRVLRILMRLGDKARSSDPGTG